LFRRIVREVYGEDYVKRFWQRIDIVGDIAVLRVPFGVSVEELRPIAERLLERLGYLRSVWAAASPVEGDFRLRRLVHLAGERRSVTVYREHGCVFEVDISRVYVSPRLSFEHARIAGLVRDGEVLINMYAGAGLFSIITARRRSVRVYSIDLNRDAYSYMVRNVLLNKVEGRVIPMLGDSSVIVPELLHGVADRILMPLPEKALEHLPAAMAGLREGRGLIHLYLHVPVKPGMDPRMEAARIVEERLRELGVKRYHLLGARKVRGVGPRRVQVVVDVHVDASGSSAGR